MNRLNDVASLVKVEVACAISFPECRDTGINTEMTVNYYISLARTKSENQKEIFYL